MREIIFRGKRKDNGEWIYGDLLQIPEHDVYSIMEQKENAGNYLIDKNTIGQYTGLTANGTKIFEGDICRHFANYPGKNIYAPIAFEIGMFWLKYSEIAGMPLRDVCEKVEVVGNIHDNPELLKGVRE